MTELEKDFAKNLLKILAEEHQKDAKLGRDSMRSTSKAYNSISTDVLKQIANHHTHVADKLHQDVVAPLERFIRNSEDTLALLKAKERKATAEVNKVSKDVKKELTKCLELLDQYNDAAGDGAVPLSKQEKGVRLFFAFLLMFSFFFSFLFACLSFWCRVIISFLSLSPFSFWPVSIALSTTVDLEEGHV